MAKAVEYKFKCNYTFRNRLFLEGDSIFIENDDTKKLPERQVFDSGSVFIGTVRTREYKSLIEMCVN
jgi:hypothetical protein